MKTKYDYKEPELPDSFEFKMTFSSMLSRNVAQMRETWRHINHRRNGLFRNVEDENAIAAANFDWIDNDRRFETLRVLLENEQNMLNGRREAGEV